MVPICPHQVKLGNLELYVEQESVPSTWYFLIALPILLAIVIVGKCRVSVCPRTYSLRLLSGQADIQLLGAFSVFINYEWMKAQLILWERGKGCTLRPS